MANNTNTVSELLEKKMNTIFQNKIGIGEIDYANDKLTLAKEDIELSFNAVYPNIKDENIYTQEIPKNPDFTMVDESGNNVLNPELDYFTINTNKNAVPRDDTDNIKLTADYNFFYWDFLNSDFSVDNPTNIPSTMNNFDQLSNEYIETHFRAITDNTKVVRKYNRIVMHQININDNSNTFVVLDNNKKNLLKDIIQPNHSEIDTTQPYNIKLEWTTVDNLKHASNGNNDTKNPEEIPYGVMGGNWFLSKNDGKIIFEDNPYDIDEEFFDYKGYSQEYTDIKYKEDDQTDENESEHILLLTFYQYIGKKGMFNLDAEKLYTLNFQNQYSNDLETLDDTTSVQTYNHIIVGGGNDELRDRIRGLETLPQESTPTEDSRYLSLNNPLLLISGDLYLRNPCSDYSNANETLIGEKGQQGENYGAYGLDGNDGLLINPEGFKLLLKNYYVDANQDVELLKNEYSSSYIRYRYFKGLTGDFGDAGIDSLPPPIQIPSKLDLLMYWIPTETEKLYTKYNKWYINKFNKDYADMKLISNTVTDNKNIKDTMFFDEVAPNDNNYKVSTNKSDKPTISEDLKKNKFLSILRIFEIYWQMIQFNKNESYYDLNITCLDHKAYKMMLTIRNIRAVDWYDNMTYDASGIDSVLEKTDKGPKTLNNNNEGNYDDKLLNKDLYEKNIIDISYNNPDNFKFNKIHFLEKILDCAFYDHSIDKETETPIGSIVAQILDPENGMIQLEPNYETNKIMLGASENDSARFVFSQESRENKQGEAPVTGWVEGEDWKELTLPTDDPTNRVIDTYKMFIDLWLPGKYLKRNEGFAVRYFHENGDKSKKIGPLGNDYYDPASEYYETDLYIVKNVNDETGDIEWLGVLGTIDPKIIIVKREQLLYRFYNDILYINKIVFKDKLENVHFTGYDKWGKSDLKPELYNVNWDWPKYDISNGKIEEIDVQINGYSKNDMSINDIDMEDNDYMKRVLHSKYYMPRRIWSTGRSDFPYLFGNTIKSERGFPHAADRNATSNIQATGLEWVAYGKSENYRYGEGWGDYENPMYDYENSSDSNIKEKWGRQRLLKTQLRKNRTDKQEKPRDAMLAKGIVIGLAILAATIVTGGAAGAYYAAGVALVGIGAGVTPTVINTINEGISDEKFQFATHFKLNVEHKPGSWTGFTDGGLLHGKFKHNGDGWVQDNPNGGVEQSLLVKKNESNYDEPFIHVGVGARALAYIDEEDVFMEHGWWKLPTPVSWHFFTHGSQLNCSIHRHRRMTHGGESYGSDSKNLVAPVIQKRIIDDGITRGNIYERLRFSYQDQVQLSLLFTASDYLIPATKMAPWKTPVMKVLTGRDFKMGSNRFTPDSSIIGDAIDHFTVFRWENRSRRWWYIPCHYNFDPKTRYFGETDPQTIFKDFESVRREIGAPERHLVYARWINGTGNGDSRDGLFYKTNGNKDFGRRYQRFIVGDMYDAPLYDAKAGVGFFGRWWHKNMIGNCYKQVSPLFGEYDLWKKLANEKMDAKVCTAIYAPRIKTYMKYNVNSMSKTDLDNINSILFCGGSDITAYYDLFGKKFVNGSEQYFGKLNDLIMDGEYPYTGQTIPSRNQREPAVYCKEIVFMGNGSQIFINSDRRIKENIRDTDKTRAIYMLHKVDAKEYNFRSDAESDKYYKETGNKKELGFIAQEVLRYMPESVIIREDTTHKKIINKNEQFLETILDYKNKNISFNRLRKYSVDFNATIKELKYRKQGNKTIVVVRFEDIYIDYFRFLKNHKYKFRIEKSDNKENRKTKPKNENKHNNIFRTSIELELTCIGNNSFILEERYLSDQVLSGQILSDQVLSDQNYIQFINKINTIKIIEYEDITLEVNKNDIYTLHTDIIQEIYKSNTREEKYIRENEVELEELESVIETLYLELSQMDELINNLEKYIDEKQ